MDHEYIEQHQIVDRYVLGKLSSEEVEHFEEHYLSCQACIDQVELAERFQAGVRRAASEDVVVLKAAQQLGLMAWLAGLGPWRRAAAVGAVLATLAILLLPSGVLYRKLVRLQEQARTGTQMADSRVDSLHREIEEAQRQLSEQEQHSRQELAEARADHQQLAEDLARARQPQSNIAIFELQQQRSSILGEPAYLVRLSAVPEWIVLSLQLEEPQRARYRVSLLRHDGSLLWQGDELMPSHLDTLVLSLHSSILEAGDYLAQVAGLSSADEAAPIATFSFRVIREP